MQPTKLLISTDRNLFMCKLHKYLPLSCMALVLASSQVMAHIGQSFYASKGMAADALVDALVSRKTVDLQQVLGPKYRQLIPADQAGNIDENVKDFLSAWDNFHALIMENDSTAFIEAGSHHWTFPIPIIKEAKGWRFDVVAGRLEINNRQIGRNELAVMQASLAYSDAQREYLKQDFDNDGVLEYAQKFISSDNQKDGLFWPTVAGETLSPLGPLFGDVTPSGAYHGYYYKILTAQGDSADGGAASYLSGAEMSGGYGLIAWPAEYGVTGVMSFKLSHHGILYEADLGADTQIIVESIHTFDPDEEWQPTADEFLSLQ